MRYADPSIFPLLFCIFFYQIHGFPKACQHQKGQPEIWGEHKKRAEGGGGEGEEQDAKSLIRWRGQEKEYPTGMEDWKIVIQILGLIVFGWLVFLSGCIDQIDLNTFFDLLTFLTLYLTKAIHVCYAIESHCLTDPKKIGQVFNAK